MLNTIGNSIRTWIHGASGRVVIPDYHGQQENIKRINNYGYSVDYDKGIIVGDRFNFDDVLGTRIGTCHRPLQPLWPDIGL